MKYIVYCYGKFPNNHGYTLLETLNVFYSYFFIVTDVLHMNSYIQVL
eukprot:UN07222